MERAPTKKPIMGPPIMPEIAVKKVTNVTFGRAAMEILLATHAEVKTVTNANLLVIVLFICKI